MTNTEKALRQDLRKYIEAQVHAPLFDKHGNEIRALPLTQIMELILNDVIVSTLKYHIIKEQY